MDSSMIMFDDDFLTIRPGERLASSVLYMAMSQLVSSRPGSTVLDPDLVYMARRTALSKDAVAQLQAIVLSVSSGDGQVFIPVLIKRHYTLAVIRHSDRTVRYYDSCGASSPGASRVVKRILPDTQNASWTHTHPRCFIQVNDHDCGVSVFLNTMHLLQKPDLQSIPSQNGMPQESHLLYWLAGRTAIFVYCKPAAPHPSLIAAIEEALEQTLALTRDVKSSIKTHEEQLDALNKVCSDMLSLYHSDSLNDLLRAVVHALQDMVAKCGTPT